ncbi:hypothetical protein N5C46_10400 [Rossellomorea vietnamensis]|uniref:Uncharacterized protein n=1 Tax=Rossellomorea vietnamensis TaxID=218284 RepID=A0ACD4CCN3_9BACI|nr:hypothetical protein [Rossellomorea vietnamensis]UXH46425.1 hypothetical protein N5C46_10400 [Rossellomorea vietnamensis]
MRKKMSVIFVLSFLAFGALFSSSASAAFTSASWNYSTHAASHGGVKLATQGTVKLGAGTLTYNGWGALNLEDAFGGSPTIDSAWVTGYAEHSQRSWFGTYSSETADFAKNTTYSGYATGYRTVVSVSYKDVVPVAGTITSIRIYPSAYIDVSNGFKSDIDGYTRVF